MKKHIRCLTINTDASFHPIEKVGGYAFYVVCDLFKIQKGGMFKKQPLTAMQAEMMCMANALYTLAAQKELPSVDLIVVNSDCLHSFHRIGRKSEDGIGRQVAEMLRTVRIRMAVSGAVMPKFDFRHVKAHNGIKDARSWVNDWCDKEAKKWMRLCVEQIKGIDVPQRNNLLIITNQ